MGDIYLKNETTGRKYIFKGISRATDGKNSNIMKMPIPDTDKPIMFNLGGQEGTFSFDFSVHLRSDDAADGTYTSAVKTIKEQRKYLLDGGIWTTSSTDDYKLYWADYLDDAGMDVMIDDITINPVAGGMNYIASISMTFGENTL